MLCLVAGGCWRAGFLRGGRMGCVGNGFYRKTMLFSAFIILLQHPRKSLCLEVPGAYKGASMDGKLTGFILFFNSRFESSSHAISMSAYLREQRRELYSRSGELQGRPTDTVLLWIILLCRSLNILSTLCQGIITSLLCHTGCLNL